MAKEASFQGKKLVIAPRRFAGVEPGDILARYFPGLELELDGPELVFLSDILDDESFDGLESGGFALVVAVESFEHVRRPALLASTVFRALEPGGGFLASVPFVMPLHEIDRDYWRFAPQGLAALLEDAGFSDVEVADSGEEEHWDVVGEMPGLVKVWMPHPRICYALCRKPQGVTREVETDENGHRGLLEDVAYGQEFMDLMARVDDLVPTVGALEEQVKDKDEKLLALSRHIEDLRRHIEDLSRHIEDLSRHIEDLSRHIEEVEADNTAKQDEMEKVSAWAGGMESELLALRAAGGPAAAETQQQPDAKPGTYLRMRSMAGRVLRKLHLRK